MQKKIRHFFQPNFMLVLSAACPAECKYCFGPHEGEIIDRATFDKLVTYMEKVVSETKQEKVNITFHGGEPLMASVELWTYALEQLSNRFKNKEIRFSLQSNLWRLNDELCLLFKKYKVSIGSSLDGPKSINDAQRGIGYFEKTYKGLNLAEQYGIEAGCIATFTPKNIKKWQEVMDFYIHEKMSFSIHPSVKPVGFEHDKELFIDSRQYSDLLSDMLEAYIENRKNIRIDSLDQLCRSVVNKQSVICTFRDCFGMFVAIDPKGNIYSCQRFCGNKEFALGNVKDQPSLSEIENNVNATMIKERERQVAIQCNGCDHIKYCKGGCYYNAVSGGDSIVDPYCEAYKNTFDRIKSRLTEEIKSKENIEAIQNISLYDEKEPFFLQKGKIISLVKQPHPSIIAQNARLAIALHEIAKGPDIESAAYRMAKNGVTLDEEQTKKALEQIKNGMLQHRIPQSLNNIYIHITFNCNLRCSHCYANANVSGDEDFMPLKKVDKLLQEAVDYGFRQIVITGGEPLVHPDIEQLLLIFKKFKGKGTNLVLRTNMTGKFSDNFLYRMAEAYDQVVVSVDGNEQTHNKRRGAGTYSIMKQNIARYQKIAKKTENPAELSLACVMTKKDINGEPGDAVRKLGNELSVKRLRFRPLLPLGRTLQWKNAPTSEAINSHVEPIEYIKQGIRPNLSCGLGHNLYVEPSGLAFPCYAYHKPHAMLGNVLEQSLENVLDSSKFKKLSSYNVDSIHKCKNCEYRYICGGACRAWSGEKGQYEPDAAPVECSGLKNRAMEIVEAAKSFLNENY